MELTTFKTALWITAIALAIAAISLLAFSAPITAKLFAVDPLLLKISGVICTLLALDYIWMTSLPAAKYGMMKLAATTTGAIALFDAGVLLALANKFSDIGIMVMLADIALFALLATVQYHALSRDKARGGFSVA